MTPNKVLVFVDWYLPGYKAGGPIRSVSNIINALKNEFEFQVFTRNCDLGESKPYENIISDHWTNHPDGYRVYYASPKSLSLKNIRKILFETEYDILYLNGIFSLRFNILPLLIGRFTGTKKKIIVSPRGMLSSGALALKKNKKKIFLFLSKLFDLYRNVTWHASSLYEEKEIFKVAGNVNIVKAMNISLHSKVILPQKIKNKGEASFFFLSRVSRVKNLLNAIQILKQVKSGLVHFDIYGPVEDELYWKKCQLEIQALKGNVKINYKGPLQSANKQAVLSKYHFMLFPTMNENYGHSIYESFSSGCPVIISDQTPWKNLEEKEIGWDIPLDQKEKFLQTVEHCIRMDQDEYQRLSKKAHEFSVKIANSLEIIDQNRRLFLS